jgi:MFS family permease
MPEGATSITPARSGWRAATVSLQERQFRWIFMSNLAFFFAMNGQMLVRSKLAYDLTDQNDFALGIVNLAVALPMLVISPFGGVIADRFERKRLIMVGQAMLLLNEIFVFSLLLTDSLEFWHLCVAAFVMGCMFPFIMPARQAIVANVVGKERLGNAMALQLGGMNCARVAGPVTAGLVISVVGVKPMYAVAVVLYLLALTAMSRIDRSPPLERIAKSVLRDLSEGVKYVRDDHPVRALLLLSMVPILLAMPFQMLLVVFADEVWHTGDLGFGLLQAGAGLGGILGSIFVAAKGDSPRKQRMMMSSLLAFGGTLLAFSFSPWFVLALPLVLISDIFASTFNTVNNTAIQVIIPDEVRGRVMSLMMMTFGLTPLGTLPVSAAAEAWGAPIAVGGASIVMIVVSLLFMSFNPSLRRIDEVSREALRGAREDIPLRIPDGPPVSAVAAASSAAS